MTLRPIVFIGLIGLILIAVYTTPTVIADTNEDRVTATTIAEGSTITVYNSLNATLVNVTSTNATVSVEDTREGVSKQAVINNSSTHTFTLDGDDVSVTVDNVTAGTEADLTFVYAPTFGMDDGMTFLVENLGMILLGILIILLFPLAWAGV